MKSKVVILVIAGILSSCSALNRMSRNSKGINYRSTPELLEAKGNMVAVRIEVNFPPKYFHPGVVVEATPVLVFEGGSKAFPAKILQGEKVLGNNTVIPYEEGKTVIYTGSVPYEDAMRISDLEIHLNGYKGKKAKVFASVKIGRGVLATATLLDTDARMALGKDKFERITKENKEAQILYKINSAVIPSKTGSSADMNSMRAFIKKMAKEENVELKNIEVRSYASPDGKYAFNDRLANNRSLSSRIFLKEKLNRDKVKKHKEAGFWKEYVVAEDWEGLKKALETSDIRDKDLIIRVLSMHDDPEVREREIRNLASVFSVLSEEILPKLRRSHFVVNAERIGKSDEEIVSLALMDPDKLNKEELLYAATFFDETAPKISIYRAVTRKSPEDWRGYNDLGIALFEEEKIEEAVENFNKAAKLNSSSKEVYNNLGAIALYKGNIEEAGAFFGAATGIPEADYNKGIVAVFTGNYEEALSYLKEPSANAVLLRILKGDIGKAKELSKKVDEDDFTYYLKAVIGSRENNINIVLENLKKAFEINPALKSMAITDREFEKYFENTAFKSITC